MLNFTVLLAKATLMFKKSNRKCDKTILYLSKIQSNLNILKRRQDCFILNFSIIISCMLVLSNKIIPIMVFKF